MLTPHRNLIIGLLLLIFSIAGYGQSSILNSMTYGEFVRRYRYNAPPEIKLKLAKEIEFYLLERNNSKLLAPQEYYAKFSTLLNDKKVNLARLHPDRNCFGGKVVSVDEAGKCTDSVPLLGDGSYYSFRLKTNVNQKWKTSIDEMRPAQWADLKLTNGNLTTGSQVVQGLIADFGNRDFDALTPDSADLKLLNDYKIETRLFKIEEQKADIKKGIRLGEHTFTDSVPAKINKLYVLRSVAYRTEFYGLGDSQFDQNLIPKIKEFDDPVNLRTDITVAFKIVGEERDGSLIILWKELRQKKAPFVES